METTAENKSLVLTDHLPTTEMKKAKVDILATFSGKAVFYNLPEPLNIDEIRKLSQLELAERFNENKLSMKKCCDAELKCFPEILAAWNKPPSERQRAYPWSAFLLCHVLQINHFEEMERIKEVAKTNFNTLLE